MISTHILDTTKGLPAQNVTVLLELESASGWKEIGKDKTNTDGRIVFNNPKEKGVYRLTFSIEDYYKSEEHFFMNTPIVFQIKDTDRKYHVPMLLNPYGYSTYRGS
ncbi:MAG TPA: hydroxyisourate hydrolase [Bacteriovoracaceae bacterium]|nr:hydroxyisourate hydrolase [Bacteriovoracaceae bacterium]